MSDALIAHVAPGIHTIDTKQRFLGLEMGARMTILTLDQGLLVHSPIAVEPSQIAHLGDPRWVLAPNLFHHLYVGPWAEAGIETWGAPGLPDKRKDVAFAGTLTTRSHPFGPDIEVLPLSCFDLTREVVVLHRPSRTLIVTDLVINLAQNAPRLTRWALRCACGYPGCRTTLLERVGMRRDAARRDLETIAAWDFDRLIMAHGEVIPRNGKAALLGAFRWLLD